MKEGQRGGWREGVWGSCAPKQCRITVRGRKSNVKNPLYFIVRKWTKISTAFLVFPLVKQKWFRQEEVKKLIWKLKETIKEKNQKLVHAFARK